MEMINYINLLDDLTNIYYKKIKPFNHEDFTIINDFQILDNFEDYIDKIFEKELDEELMIDISNEFQDFRDIAYERKLLNNSDDIKDLLEIFYVNCVQLTINKMKQEWSWLNENI